MPAHSIDRRHVLMGGLGLWGGLGLGLPGCLRREDPRTLVLVQLSGGNDGLSTVIPFQDDDYHRARPTLGHDAASVLQIDDTRGLHPELELLRARYDEGGLAIVEGVGYPRPNRSHFASLEIWHTADLRGRLAGEGWIGRLCEAAYGEDSHPNRVVHVGKTPPYSLFSTRHPAASFSAPYGYRRLKNGAALKELESLEAVDEGKQKAPGGSLAFLRARMSAARESSGRIRAAAAGYRTPVEYPSDPFADELRTVAALLNGNLGARVMSVELDGFDTHDDQRVRHDALMRRLDSSLGAFLEDLDRSEVGRAALVVVLTEFGRRVAENGSGGTDHGCAGLMFVAGASVKGGLYGQAPSLTRLDEGDLIFTTDFRSVYGTVIESQFDVAHADVLGSEYPRLGFG
jgi:uncharacterized protein (DUF1501 family)